MPKLYSCGFLLLTDSLSYRTIEKGECNFMKDKIDSFDRLVAGLLPDERITILRQLKINIDPEKEAFLSNEQFYGERTSNLKENFKKESVFLKIVLFLKSMFTSTPIDQVYSEHCVSFLVRRTDTNYPGLVNPRSFRLENGFYEYLLELRRATTFFK